MLCVDITVNVWLIVPVHVSKHVVVRRLLRYLTQRLFLHYLGSAQPAKYHFYPM